MRAIGVIAVLVGCSGDGAKDDAPTDGTVVTDADEDGVPVPTDCDDTDATVYPGADDPAYDGVDADCGGDSDYDADGDGFDSDTYGGDDCVDGNPDISPGAAETPYDGVDNDCDPSSPDDDVDQDGFLLAQDCDDADAAAFPGGLEVLGDAADGDCDGLADGAPFGHSDLLWDTPTRPRAALTDRGFVVSAAAAEVEGGPVFPAPNVQAAVALTLPLDGSGPAAPSIDPVVWRGEYDDEVMADVDIVSTGDGFVAATTYYSPVNRFGYLMVQPLDWVGVSWFPGPPSYLSDALTDAVWVDVALDPSGTPWACASDADAIVYARGEGLIPAPGAWLDGVDGDRGCVLGSGVADLPFTTCDTDGACVTWATDPDGGDPTPVPAGAQPFASDTWLSARERDGVVTARPDGGGVLVVEPDGTRWELLAGLDVLDAEATFDGAEVWLAVVADRGAGPELLLAWGDPTAPLAESWLPVEDLGRDLAPTGATVVVTADRVLVAVAADEIHGGADTVAWTLFGR